METKLQKLILYKMTLPSLKGFMNEYNLKIDALNEFELQRIYNYPIYPRDSKIYLVKGFINIDVGPQGGTHWYCFITKDNKAHLFDSFEGQPDKFLLNHLPKPISYHK